MSHVLDKLTFFTNKAPETFASGHGITTDENRDWNVPIVDVGRMTR